MNSKKECFEALQRYIDQFNKYCCVGGREFTFNLTRIDDGSCIINCLDEAEERKRKEKLRSAWVEKWYGAYWRDGRSDVATCHNRYIAVYRNYTDKHGRDRTVIGEAWCRDSDTFDTRVGTAIAYAKTHKEPIPDYI